MARTPNTNSLRAKLLEHFASNPGSTLTRQEIMDRFGIGITTVESAIGILKRDGYVACVRDSGKRVHYFLVGAAPALPRRRDDPKPVRKWSESSYYEAPRPIPNSVFSLAATMGVGQ
jgi:DNA-binding transcriptional regulator PaaX